MDDELLFAVSEEHQATKKSAKPKDSLFKTGINNLSKKTPPMIASPVVNIKAKIKDPEIKKSISLHR